MARLLIQNVSKVFKVPGKREIRAVDGINLEVADGESAVLVGPSGSGKTVTLRLIAGLEEPSSGSISLGDRPLNGVPAGKRDVAMVFQSHSLYPHVTAEENLGFGLKVRGVPRVERDRRVRETAELLGISDCLALRPVELSGGQRQRVALGRALVRRPALFLFDEPFSNLDGPLRTQLRAEFLRLQKELRWTSLCVTHDQKEAMALGSKLAVIHAGRICQTGAPGEVYSHPASCFVAGFLGDLPMSFVPGRIDKAGEAVTFEAQGCATLNLQIRCSQWEKLKTSAGKLVLLGIRPEAVRVLGEAPPGVPGWKGLVETVQVLGSEAYLQVRCGPFLLGARTPASPMWSPGQEVALEFEEDAGHFFDAESGAALAL